MELASIYRFLAAVINLLPTSFRAKLWQYALRAGSRRWEAESLAQRIPGGMYIKASSYRVRHSEGEAMRYIRRHTSVPVPVVVDNFTYDGITYLVMSRMPGHPIASVYHDITPEIECRLSAQLSAVLASLRALPSPSSAVCGFGGGPVYCARIRFGGADPAGPWDSVGEFHEDLVRRTGGLEFPEGIVEEKVALDAIHRAHTRGHGVCLTHNDLGPHNILVDDQWTITGIIDWENAAWMPEYWELTKGTFSPQYRRHRWSRILTAVFSTYALEQEAERYIYNYRRCYA